MEVEACNVLQDSCAAASEGYLGTDAGRERPSIYSVLHPTHSGLSTPCNCSTRVFNNNIIHKSRPSDWADGGCIDARALIVHKGVAHNLDVAVELAGV